MDILRKLRFETLPLSLSGVIVGVLLAAADYKVDWKVAVALLVATALLHLSVNADRYAEEDQQMKKVSSVLLALTVITGVFAVYLTFGTLLLIESFVLMLFGYVVIRTARHSDFFDVSTCLPRKLVPVLLLTSLVPVYGSYYMCSHAFGTWLLLLPALAVGSLNLALVRNGTEINEEGESSLIQKIIQVVLVVISWAAMTAFAALRMYDIWHYLYVCSLPLFLAYIYVLLGTTQYNKLTAFKILLASSFVYSLLGGLGYVIFLLG